MSAEPSPVPTLLLWHCARCFALNEDATCRVCGADRDAEPPEVPQVPRTMRPLRRTASTTHGGNPNRSLLAPAMLLAAAFLLAAGFEPVASEVAFANVPGATVEHRQLARQADLQRAARDLRELDQDLHQAIAPGGVPLPKSWRGRLDTLERRHRLYGERNESAFADQEVALRAFALELASIHHRYVAGTLAEDVLPRLAAAERELARVTEELTHAR